MAKLCEKPKRFSVSYAWTFDGQVDVTHYEIYAVFNTRSTDPFPTHDAVPSNLSMHSQDAKFRGYSSGLQSYVSEAPS